MVASYIYINFQEAENHGVTAQWGVLPSNAYVHQEEHFSLLQREFYLA